MKILIRTEEAAMFIMALLFYQQSGMSWASFAIFFLAPDLSMLGYLINPKSGAWVYNLVHHRGIALSVLAAGYFQHSEMTEFAGIILFSHSTFDRMLGYGLKYPDSFHHTHLGTIGVVKNQSS